MNSYCSFLVANPYHLSSLKSLNSIDDWSLEMNSDPSGRYWFSSTGVIHQISHPSALGSQLADDIPGKLMVFKADEITANNIIQLICASYDVLEGNPTDRIGLRSAFEIPCDVEKQRSLFCNVFQTHGYFEKFVHRPELPVAIHIATKAWRDKSLIYAIHKLARSVAIDSITWWSAAPMYGQVFEKSSEYYSEHVSTSVAINLAFSAIEELQLQIKSSSEKKRFIDNKAGFWNPEVLKDIKCRLHESGIDPEQKVRWILRGDESPAENNVKPKRGNLIDEHNVAIRDIELNLPDAIHYCSYIRNFMTAHRFSENSSFLGPYDVHNVQCVARRLILSKCGMWNVECVGS